MSLVVSGRSSREVGSKEGSGLRARKIVISIKAFKEGRICGVFDTPDKNGFLLFFL